MLHKNLSLHFKTEEAYSGFAAVSGIMHTGKLELILEYQMKDNILGMLKSRPKVFRIPFSAITSVEYKVNWFISKFHLHINSMQVLGEFPVGKNGTISLNIPRKQKQIAKEMASNLNLRLSEYRLQMMDEEYDD